MVNVAYQGATDQRCKNVAHGPVQRRPKLAARKPWTARRGIFHTGTHATGISKDLAKCNQNCKGNRKLEAQNPIKARPESEATNGGEESFPG